MKNIAIKAMCLIRDDTRLFISKGYDKVTKKYFYRFLGGGVSFGEMAEDAIRREIKEETGSNIENLKFLTVIENVFTYEGEKGHEITFLYQGDLEDKNLYNIKYFRILDEDEDDLPVEWIPISDVLEKKVILYPSFDYKKLLLKDLRYQII